MTLDKFTYLRRKKKKNRRTKSVIFRRDEFPGHVSWNVSLALVDVGSTCSAERERVIRFWHHDEAVGAKEKFISARVIINQHQLATADGVVGEVHFLAFVDHEIPRSAYHCFTQQVLTWTAVL